MFTSSERPSHLSELNMGWPLWSLHKLWGFGAFQGDGEEGFMATAVLSHNLSPQDLTAHLCQYKQHGDMTDLCTGDIKECNCSF